jgi:hypothetical protein
MQKNDRLWATLHIRSESGFWETLEGGFQLNRLFRLMATVDHIQKLTAMTITLFCPISDIHKFWFIQ